MMPNTPSHRLSVAGQEGRNPDVYCKTSRSRAAQSGFTLIEILVTISIISLLVGLTAIGATVIARGAQESRTKAMCLSLLGPKDEFKAQNGQGLNLNHDNNDNNFPINWGLTFNRNAPGSTGTAAGAGLSSSERFIVGCYLFDSSGDALRAAVQGNNTLIDLDGDGFLEIRDPWESELIYRADNVPSKGNYDNRLPTSRDPFFISSGRDGTFALDGDDIDSIEIGS